MPWQAPFPVGVPLPPRNDLARLDANRLQVVLQARNLALADLRLPHEAQAEGAGGAAQVLVGVLQGLCLRCQVPPPLNCRSPALLNVPKQLQCSDVTSQRLALQAAPRIESTAQPVEPPAPGAPRCRPGQS